MMNISEVGEKKGDAPKGRLYIRRPIDILFMTSARVAVRTGSSTLNYLLGDHLGSTAITTDVNGGNLAEVRYFAWGTERWSSGTTPTTLRYTGQRLESLLGMYDYGARWYDPYLGRFVQADTVVPGGVQGLDRYAYTFNNPLKYTDPSGHEICDGDGYCGDDQGYEKDTTWIWYLNKMQGEFDWQVDGDWKYQELVLLYKTGSDISNYVNNLGGNGQEWVNRNMGVTVFYLGTTANITNKILHAGGSLPWKRGINLNSGFSEYDVLHELGHRWDIKANNSICPSTWCGGGLADRLVKYIGGNPKGLRFINGVNDIPAKYQWLPSVSGGYGNTASTEYFAESFAWLIIDLIKLPPANIIEWMNIEMLK